MVDNTRVYIHDTSENQLQFPQHLNQEARVGYPVARMVVLTDMSAGGLLDTAIEPCKGKVSHGQTLVGTLLDNVKSADVLPGYDIFSGYFLLYE